MQTAAWIVPKSGSVLNYVKIIRTTFQKRNRFGDFRKFFDEIVCERT